MAQWLGRWISDQGVPGSNPSRCTFRCGLGQVTLTLLSTGLTQKAVDGQPTWTDCDEAGDYVVPNVLSPRDLVFRPDNMDETVPHIWGGIFQKVCFTALLKHRRKTKLYTTMYQNENSEYNYPLN